MKMIIETFSSPDHKYTVEGGASTKIESVNGHSFLEVLDDDGDLLFSVAIGNVNTVVYSYDD